MKNKHKKSLVWVRRDLRLLDNTALSHATQNSDSVAVVFVFDKQILQQLKNKEDRRITFIYDSLIELDKSLNELGSNLIVVLGDPCIEIPKLVRDMLVDALYFNEDYEPYAISRDNKVKEELGKIGVSSYMFKDHVIFSGNEVLKSNASPYQVFTAYKKAWLKKLNSEDYGQRKLKKTFIRKKEILKYIHFPKLEDIGFERTKFYYDFQKPGRKNGVQQIKRFAKNIKEYQRDRDFPYKNGTSGLSVHLRFGTISIRECLRLCLNSTSLGNKTWLSEIIWRDFYQMILFQFPYITNKAFKSKYQNISWQGTEKHFKAWCEGRTGYPIVDSAMRQLNRTGWMHNRLRMIVASFLTKDLLIDWRKGESYFAEHLLDFDLASNNGGWQWSASTGCDAQPYFRIFNPELQSKKFDCNGDFIRLWVPELEGCSKKEIHCPIDIENYPSPIVEHKKQKILALKMFQHDS